MCVFGRGTKIIPIMKIYPIPHEQTYKYALKLFIDKQTIFIIASYNI